MRLIDAKQASEILGVRLPRLYELVRLKTVPFVRIGSRQIRFDPDELSEWAKRGGNVEPSEGMGKDAGYGHG
jgi:excisionase family DNA binding protein